jgi:hypothetical protein
MATERDANEILKETALIDAIQRLIDFGNRRVFTSFQAWLKLEDRTQEDHP